MYTCNELSSLQDPCFIICPLNKKLSWLFGVCLFQPNFIISLHLGLLFRLSPNDHVSKRIIELPHLVLACTNWKLEKTKETYSPVDPSFQFTSPALRRQKKPILLLYPCWMLHQVRLLICIRHMQLTCIQ